MRLWGAWQWSPTCSETLSNWLTTLGRRTADSRPQIMASPLDISPTCSLVARRLLWICRVCLFHWCLKILTGSEMTLKARDVFLNDFPSCVFLQGGWRPMAKGWPTSQTPRFTPPKHPEAPPTLLTEASGTFWRSNMDQSATPFVSCSSYLHCANRHVLNHSNHVYQYYSGFFY